MFDAVIIGSGAGGAAAAWRLTTGGMKVLLLEAGPWFDPATDYPLNQPGWERRPFPEKPGSRATVTYGDLGTLDPSDADLRSWTVVEGRQPPPTVRAVGAGYSHVQGVGGSTLHFVGEAHRMHPGALAGWPLEYAELEPYYQTCERLIGVAGPADQQARWRSAPFPLPPHPLSPGAQVLAAVGTRIGMEWQANSRAALSQPYDDRPPCNYCAACSRGCPLGDKGSADVTFLRHAEATGNLTIRANAPVLRINAGAGGRIGSVEYLDGDKRASQETPVLILAAGAVQTPRLLLLSAYADLPDGVANGSGQVGRNFMETLGWRSTGLMPRLTNSHMGLPADAICWDFNAPDAVPGAVGGCRFNATTQETGLTGPIAYGARLIDGFGATFKDRMRSAFGSALAVGAIAEVIPDERCRVILDPDVRDAHGDPVARISSVLTANSLTLLHFMAAKCRALLAEAEIVEEAGSWDSFTATHVFGTCRMGTDAATSVVNAQGRAHDHENLWMADASVFPSSGGGESPSLTISALAVRTAEAVLA